MSMDVNEVRMSLVEVVKRHDPDGNLSTIAEVLNKQNDMIADAVWREANDNYSNKTNRRASLPTGTWRKFNPADLLAYTIYAWYLDEAA